MFITKTIRGMILVKGKDDPIIRPQDKAAAGSTG